MANPLTYYPYTPYYWNYPITSPGQQDTPVLPRNTFQTKKTVPAHPSPEPGARGNQQKTPPSKSWLQAGLAGIQDFFPEALAIPALTLYEEGRDIQESWSTLKQQQPLWKRFMLSMARLYAPIMVMGFGLGLSQDILPKWPAKNRWEGALDQARRDLPAYLAGVLTYCGVEKLLPARQRLSPGVLLAMMAGIGLPFSLFQGAYQFGRKPGEEDSLDKFLRYVAHKVSDQSHQQAY